MSTGRPAGVASALSETTRRLRSVASAARTYRPYPVPDEAGYGNGDGPWASLRQLSEAPHYGVIAAYLQHVAPAGRVLDVGCGEGVIVPHLDSGCRYVGVDVSAQAVARARHAWEGIAGRRFEVGDGATFSDGQHDAVVFNESLYYLPDPAAVLDHHERVSSPGGWFVVSMYGAPTTGRVWRALDAVRTPTDGVVVSRGPATWEIRLYRCGQ